MSALANPMSVSDLHFEAPKPMRWHDVIVVGAAEPGVAVAVGLCRGCNRCDLRYIVEELYL